MTQRVVALEQEVDRLSSDGDVESVSLLWFDPALYQLCNTL